MVRCAFLATVGNGHIASTVLMEKLLQVTRIFFYIVITGSLCQMQRHCIFIYFPPPDCQKIIFEFLFFEANKARNKNIFKVYFDTVLMEYWIGFLGAGEDRVATTIRSWRGKQRINFFHKQDIWVGTGTI
jgi:hypothetical protein